MISDEQRKVTFGEPACLYAESIAIVEAMQKAYESAIDRFLSTIREKVAEAFDEGVPTSRTFTLQHASRVSLTPAH